MRSLFHFRWLLALLLGLSSLPAAHASHVRGGDIAYTSVASTTPGLPRYHVVVRLFLNPLSAVKQETIDLVANPGSCGVLNAGGFKVTIPKLSSTTSQNQPCQGPALLYSIALYATDLDLSLGQWTLSCTTENRSGDIINASNTLSSIFTISAFLDNTLATQDTSPQFESVLVPGFDGNVVPRYSFSTFDADADSLHYDFMQPQTVVDGSIQAGGVVQAGACSKAVTGFQLPAYFALDAGTGALAPATPSGQQGYYLMAARVSEYRRLLGRWQLIGYVTRDLTYVTVASPNQMPDFTSLSVNGGAAQALNQPIAAHPGQTLRLTLTAADPDAGQQLRFTSEAPNVVPGLSLTTLSGTQALLTWQVPATLPAGHYAIPVGVLDNGCPYNASQERTLVVTVSNQALATRTGLPAESGAYPVPFREQVQFTAAPNQAVTVVDALGRPVARLLSAADGRVQWQPAASLPAGLYLARTADGRVLARLLHE